jgi:zinc protease
VIREEMAKIASGGVTDAELAKARRQIEAEVIFDRDSTDQIAGSLSEAIAVADWEWYADYPALIGRVSAEDVQRAAASIFQDDGLTVGLFQPKGQAA